MSDVNNTNSNVVRKTLSQRRKDASITKLQKAADRATKQAKDKKVEAERYLRLREKAEKLNAANAVREAQRLARENAAQAKADAALTRKLQTASRTKSLDVLIDDLIAATQSVGTTARTLAMRFNEDWGLGWHLLDPKATTFSDNERTLYKTISGMKKRMADAYVKAGKSEKGKYMPFSRVKTEAVVLYNEAMGITPPAKGSNDKKPLREGLAETLPRFYRRAMELQNTVEDEQDQRLFSMFATKLGELLVLAGVDLTSLNAKA